jgi:cytochrome oxidase Cu insertion factor (SCO1/SenC/PrrC family)
VTRSRSDRPGPAFVALVAIVMITVAWWTLALWPVGTAEPEWLARTRSACFGSARGGLPDAGGWILLVGEPVGMLGLLITIWGGSLAADLRAVRAHRGWRSVATALAAAVVVVFATLAVRVTLVQAATGGVARDARQLRTRLDVEVPIVALIDQHGRRVSFADFLGHPALLTFAFGHCTTVCPTIVRDAIAARAASGRKDLRLLVVTLDPWRDTPDRLPSLVEHWGLSTDDRVLSGSIADVEAALDALGVGRRRNTTTGDIEHSGAALYLDETGKITSRLDGALWRVSDLIPQR